MTRETTDFLKQLKSATLFRSVGKATDLVPLPTVNDWHAAIKECASQEWSYIQTDTSNILRSHIASVDMKAFRKWNDVVQSMYPLYQDWVARAVGSALQDYKSVQSVIDSTMWDVLFICMEFEYANCKPPLFYQNLASIYLDGHFPCGWRGKYPSAGDLKIY